MAANHWIAGISGNWDVAENWSGNVPTSVQAAQIAAPGAYTVTLSDAQAVSIFDMDAAGATLMEAAGGSLAVTNQLTLDDGTVILHGTNTIGTGVLQNGGLLEVFKGGALGAGTITMTAGTFAGMATESVANGFQISGDTTVIAAAHGKTVKLENTGGWKISGPAVVNFGDATRDGTIVWSGAGTVTGTYSVEVHSGVLKAGDAHFFDLGGMANAVTIDAGATINTNGFNFSAANLLGNGIITSSTSSELTLANANFSGTITGAIGLELSAGSAVLSGSNTYTGGTQIDSGGNLHLGGGATRGSVKGAIADNGTLFINHSNKVVLANHISGSGQLVQSGKGTTIINHAETYAGGTSIDNGILSIDRAAAIGTGAITLNAELLATKTLTLANDITAGGKSIMAAAHGTVTTFTGDWTVLRGTTFTFGAAGDDGVINWATASAGTLGPDAYSVLIADGTLRQSNESPLGALLANSITTTIRAGATLDAHGYSSDYFEVGNLRGAGTLTNSTAATRVQLKLDTANNFSGKITGNMALSVSGSTVLTGTSTYSGKTTVLNASVLALGNGGAGGSVKGAIVLESGTLIADHSGTFNLTNKISGTGTLQIRGGTTVIDHANTFAGRTAIVGGTLSINQAAALGSGELDMQAGKLLATASMTLADKIDLNGNVNIAAAHGKALTLAPTDLEYHGPTLSFGSAAADGAVVIGHADVLGLNGGQFDVEVKGGTLKSADDNTLFTILSNDKETIVDAGAAINWAGSANAAMIDLHGAGVITNSGSAITLNIYGGNFAGKLNGAMAVHAVGDLTLSGGGNFSGGLTIESGVTLTLSNAAHENITLAGASKLVLFDPDQYTGTLHGFGAGDAINLRDIATVNNTTLAYNRNTHVLTVKHGSDTDTFHFAGDYHAANFHLVADGATGIDIEFHAEAALPAHHAADSGALTKALVHHGHEWFEHHAAHGDALFG